MADIATITQSVSTLAQNVATETASLDLGTSFVNLWHRTGLYNYFVMSGGLGQLIMILVCLFLIYLAIKKQYEPLLLLPIAFGGLL